MMNIGFNPTVNGDNLSLEVHFIDFESDLYDQKITVSILKYIRPEIKFESIDRLKEQLNKDKQATIAYFKGLY